MFSMSSKRCTPVTNEEITISQKFIKIIILTYLLDNLIQITNGIKMLKFIQVINNEISSIDILKKIFDFIKYDTKHPSLLCFGGIPRDLILYCKKLHSNFDPNISSNENYMLFTKNLLSNNVYIRSINDIDLLELPESDLYNSEVVIFNLLQKLSNLNKLCGFYTNFQYWRYNNSYNSHCQNSSIKYVRCLELIITFGNIDNSFRFKIDLVKINNLPDFSKNIHHSSDSLLMTLSENYFKHIEEKTFIDKYYKFSIKNFSFTDWYNDSFSLLNSNLKSIDTILIVCNYIEHNFIRSSDQCKNKEFLMYWKNLYFRNFEKWIRSYTLVGFEEIDEHFKLRNYNYNYDKIFNILLDGLENYAELNIYEKYYLDLFISCGRIVLLNHPQLQNINININIHPPSIKRDLNKSFMEFKLLLNCDKIPILDIRNNTIYFSEFEPELEPEPEPEHEPEHEHEQETSL